MTDDFESDPLQESNREFQELRLRLSRLPRRNAPPELILKLKKQYIGSAWRERLRAWFAWPSLWKPVGVFALGAAIAGAGISHWKNSKEAFIDGEPLMAAHARYQAESLVPQGDLANSNFGTQLAAYYGDQN